MNLTEQQQKLAAVAGLYDMFMRVDASKIKDCVSAEYEQFPPPNPDAKPGLENFMKGFGSSFSDIKGEITHLMTDGAYVFARCEYSMVHTGEAYGIPATGRNVKFDAFDLHLVEDGKVTKSWHLEDYMTICNQIKD